MLGFSLSPGEVSSPCYPSVALYSNFFPRMMYFVVDTFVSNISSYAVCVQTFFGVRVSSSCPRLNECLSELMEDLRPASICHTAVWQRHKRSSKTMSTYVHNSRPTRFCLPIGRLIRCITGASSPTESAAR